MARAYVDIDQTVNQGSADTVSFYINVGFYGSDVSPENAGPFPVATPLISSALSATQIKTQIADSAIAKAAELGLTVANGDVLMCDIVKI